MAEVIKKYYRRGQWSTKNPNHIYWHEQAHAYFHDVRIMSTTNPNENEKYSKIRNLFISVKSDTLLKRQVSAQSMYDVDEFVAEEIAEYLAGGSNTISNKVFQILKGGLD